MAARNLLNLRVLAIILFLGLFIFTPTTVWRSEFAGDRNSKFSAVTSNSDLLHDVFNQTLGFQKIFVINLPFRTDKRDAITLAASLTGLQLEFVDGVEEVDKRTLPPGGPLLSISHANLGCWRAHVNAIRRVVEQNLTSALILEDDADWDLRIKAQMRNFARASRMLIQPLPGTSNAFLDPSYPRPSPSEQPQNFDIAKSPNYEPSTSPYGDIDRWDLLWLGHCGTRFPASDDENVPIGRAVILNDETVPERQHIQMEYGNSDLVNEYPDHTRVVSRARDNTCAVAYGISQPGAHRFLYELGLRTMDDTNDKMLRSICDGSNGRRIRTCLTVQPQLFQHHRPVAYKSTFSDISEHSGEFNKVAFTRNVRWSTRVNLPKLVDNETDWIDLFKDGEEANPGLGFG